MKKKVIYLAIISFLIPAFINIQKPLQAENLEKPEKFEIGLSFYHPSFSNSGISTLSGSFELFAGVPVNNNLNIYGILPFSEYSLHSEYYYNGVESYSGIGNIVLGLKYFWGDKRNFLFNGGIALPTTGDDNANFLSYISRIYDLQKYAPNNTSLFAEFEGKHTFENNVFVGGGTGLRLFIWTGKGSNDAELFLPFNLFVGYEREELIGFSAAFTGIYYLTNKNGDFEDNIMDILRLNVKYPGATVEPGLTFELPFNKNYKDMLDYNIGFNILVKIK